MTRCSEPPIDLRDRGLRPIVVGSIVSIHGTMFEDCNGIVMDTLSDHDPEDGPIAVFLDREVDWINFTNAYDVRDWSGPTPTPENYRDCPRIVCFMPEELGVETEFSLETRARRLYGEMFHHTCAPLFPLAPNTHDCFFLSCSSGLLATEKTLVNYWGTVHEVYTCNICHGEWNGMCSESILLKDPLPGSS